MTLQIILPTFNEAENVRNMVETLLALPIPDLAVLVVDDNSPDGTGRMADELAAQFPERVAVLHRPGKQGLGTAYIEGFRQSLAEGADMILQMDCDFSHSPDYVPRMIEAMDDCDCDVVVGSRYARGGRLDDRWSIWRKLLSWFANSVYVRAILGTKVRDATGGFRLWKRETLEGLDLNRIRSNGYVFQVETIYVAEKLGFEATEIPIYFADRKLGTSKMGFKIQLEAALRVWQIWWRHRHLKPSQRLVAEAQAD